MKCVTDVCYVWYVCCIKMYGVCACTYVCEYGVHVCKCGMCMHACACVHTCAYVSVCDVCECVMCDFVSAVSMVLTTVWMIVVWWGIRGTRVNVGVGDPSGDLHGAPLAVWRSGDEASR